MDLGSQPGPYRTLLAHSGVSKADGAVDLSRVGDQCSAVERILLLSGRIHPLVVATIAGREFPTHHDDMERPDALGYRGQLPPPGDGRQGTTRAESPSVVWGDHWILGRDNSSYLDGEYSGLDADARHV